MEAVNSIKISHGSGDGSGYGSGCDGGDGCGDGYWDILAEGVCGHVGAERKLSGCTLAFWRSDQSGRPINGGSGPSVAPGLIDEVEGPLTLCTHNALHATLNPLKWRGARLWVVALYPPVKRDGDKLGSLKREILCEVPLGAKP